MDLGHDDQGRPRPRRDGDRLDRRRPVGFTDTMVITEWDPPRRCTVTHTGRIVRGEGVFEVLPRGGRREFRWTERICCPSVLALVPPRSGQVDQVRLRGHRPFARAGLATR